MIAEHRITIILIAALMCLQSGLYSGLAVASDTAGNIRPKKIVSLSPVITEALYLLGLEESITAVTIYCRKPAGAESKASIGTIVTPDIEKIVSLRPDVVMAMTLTDPREIEKLRKAGIHVISFKIPRTFSELCDVFLRLGRICGKESEAKHLIDNSVKRVASIKTKIGKAKKPSTLVQIGSSPLFVATRAFFLNDYVELAGGLNMFADLKSGTISFEQAVAGNPDVIIIAGMGISGESERRSWGRFRSISAVKNNRIYTVDADKLCSPTPVTFADYLDDIARMLHPEVFR